MYIIEYSAKDLLTGRVTFSTRGKRITRHIIECSKKLFQAKPSGATTEEAKRVCVSFVRNFGPHEDNAHAAHRFVSFNHLSKRQ